jgi:Domain of unknown function (DUF4397)
MLLAFVTLLFGIAAATSASAGAASTGWIRLGNLSQKPDPVDMYVSPSGNSTPQIVQPGVAYGTVLSYEPVSAGAYTVEIRTAGASATSKPDLSVSVTVQAGRSYTVVPLRTSSQSGQLKVLDDSLTTPAGKSLVRVIQAAVDQKSTTFHCSCGQGAAGNIVTNAPPGTVSAYAPIPPGTWTMTATGPSAKASLPITLTASTVRTEVVVDGPSGIDIVNLTDASGAGTPPVGGVPTGLGGTAPQGAASLLPWLAVIGAGVLLSLGAGLGLRRNGPRSRRDGLGRTTTRV